MFKKIKNIYNDFIAYGYARVFKYDVKLAIANYIHHGKKNGAIKIIRRAYRIDALFNKIESFIKERDELMRSWLDMDNDEEYWICFWQTQTQLVNYEMIIFEELGI